jgi:hypothetical protein
MHRWSTTTYKSCTTPGSFDDDVWQYLVPSLSLQHSFLLSGIFALTACEIANSQKHDSNHYATAAIEYHTLALGSFRSQLAALNAESHEAALCLSLMLMVFAIGSARLASKDDGGMVQRAVTAFELLRGCVPVAESKEGYLAENPYIRRLTRFEDLPRVALDTRTEDALAKMGELNDRKITASVRDSDEQRLQQVARWEACKKALGLLRQCFEKCVDRLSQGYILGWLNMAGEDYVKAVEEGDQAALLMLVYWGVLVDRFGGQVWWTRHFGRMLVEEILEGPLSDESDAISRDLILCARKLVRESSSGPAGVT